MANQFDYAHGAAMEALKLKDFSSTGDWAGTVKLVKNLFSEDGFESGSANGSVAVRNMVAKGKQSNVPAATTMLMGAGATSAPSTPNKIINGTMAAKVAALEIARRLHLVKKFGSHKVWILSLPTAYRDWPHLDLVGSFSHVAPRLNDESERFSEEDKKNLSNCTQEGLKWVHKTMVVAGSPKQKKHMELLRRWFGDEDTTDKMLETFAGTLNAGFKKISKRMKSGHLILTDNPGHRGSDYEDSEAYVWGDKLDVVYIEKSFFDYGKTQMLAGLTHWTRILVHEMTHRECNTDDVPGRYAWGGIKPNKAAFGHALAITNADSWAFFSADCAGALTQANRDAALK
jgi:hypothetical protein